MSKSDIQWTGSTWNPIAGCTPVSPGCLNCYASKMANRLAGMGQEKYRGLTVLHNGRHTFNGNINFDDDALSIPLKRKKPETYFVNSMSDLFHEAVPFEFVDKVFAVMALCPQHTFQVLTKRPERMAEYLNTPFVCNRIVQQMPKVAPDRGVWSWPGMTEAFASVWLGTSVENQKCADERIPHLLRCPATVRFLSCEPLLEGVNLEGYLWGAVGNTAGYFDRNGRRRSGGIGGQMICSRPLNTLHWMIVGGESGSKARPFDVAWARSIIQQCREVGVACFVKQLGAKPQQHCNNCGKDVGRGLLGGFVDACGPGHAQLIAECIRIKDGHGGEMSEWPEDIRVREMPKMPEPATV